MDKPAKSEFLQIRVSKKEKAAILRAARHAGMDMSGYVLSRVLTDPAARFRSLVEACVAAPSVRFPLAELNALLSASTADELRDAVAVPPPSTLAPYVHNYVSAMVEYACAKREVPVPAWTREVAPLVEPVFGTALESLRFHLLIHSPPPFRARNIFIDATVGGQV